MQKSLKLLALLAAASVPTLAFANAAGLNAPVAVTAEAAIAVYASAFVVLLALADYGRRQMHLRVPAPVLLPASDAFTVRPARAVAVSARRSFRAPQLS